MNGKTESSTSDSSRHQLRVVEVELAERSYPIVIGTGVLEQLTEWVGPRFGACRHGVIVYDTHTAHIASRVEQELRGAGWRITPLGVPAGEATKSVVHAERLWQEMLDARTDRGSTVIAVGGGVVGDLAGFVAATFARGLPLLQIPTTLLSQVDSSVGGKTGINLPGAKNIVGAFWQPNLVIIDLETLHTLPQREFRSGLAEVVKYGVILLPELFEYLEQHAEAIGAQDPRALGHVVEQSCRAKAMVVGADEREVSGHRAILNYGHTFGHAIETLTGYGHYLHGEAVAIGMQMAAELAKLMGRVDDRFVQRQRELLQRFGLPVCLTDVAPAAMWEVMQRDKKVAHGKLRFILPSRMGHVELVEGVPQELVFAAIERCHAHKTD